MVLVVVGWVVCLAASCLCAGQPELPESLGLPTDEESFNQLHLIHHPYSGTYHFVSSSFPEIDSRGFYENVFDGIGDYYPPWGISFYKKSSARFRNPHDEPEVTLLRNKRSADGNKGEAVDLHKVVRSKRAPGRYARGMEMGSSGFHENMFNTAFGDFLTMRKRRMAQGPSFKELLCAAIEKHGRSGGRAFGCHQETKRRPEMDSMGFHGDTFGGGLNDFETMKKRRPLVGGMGFHGDTFGSSFGDFETMKKRRPDMDSMGFHGDTFGGSFGDFETMKKRKPEMDSMGFHGDTFGGGFSDFETMKKRRPLVGGMGFHGDTFGSNFGDFETMKKRRPDMDSMGFHGDTFGGSFGDFETMKKRRPEMDSMGFHGDTFGGGFNDFETMKKRRPEMDSMGFHGDTFGSGFNDFETMKKRRPEMDSMGFHGDTFGGGFNDFETMKKRRPEMDSMGFHGDTFGGGFNDFETMKKRRPLVGGMGFHGDTFGGGFGNFETMKKKRSEPPQSTVAYGEGYSPEKEKKKELHQEDCNCDNLKDSTLDIPNKDILYRACLQKCKLSSKTSQ